MYRDENSQTLSGQLVKATYIADILNLTPRSVRRLAHQGVIPRPLRIGARMLRWVKDDVDAYIESISLEPDEHLRRAKADEKFPSPQ